MQPWVTHFAIFVFAFFPCCYAEKGIGAEAKLANTPNRNITYQRWGDSGESGVVPLQLSEMSSQSQPLESDPGRDLLLTQR